MVNIMDVLRKHEKKIIRISGIIGLVVSVCFLLGGIIFLVRNSTERDVLGYFATWKMDIRKDSRAVVLKPDVEWKFKDTARVKVEVTSNQPGGEVFIGLVDNEGATEYLDGLEYDEISRLRVTPFKAEYKTLPGSAPAVLPVDWHKWQRMEYGEGIRSLWWSPDMNRTLVIMNVDGSAGLDVKVTIWTTYGYLFLTGITSLVIGIIVGILSFFAIYSTGRSTNPVYPGLLEM
jgi:hypothetical protein